MTRLIHGLLILLNIAAVLALVLVKLGTFISPATFLPTAYASLALLSIVIVNLLFAIFWLFLRRWWALLSIITLFVFSGLVQSAFAVNLVQKVDPNRQHLKILSYNTMQMASMKKHKEDDPNEVVKYILDSDADIVCLQEFAVSRNDHQFMEKDFEQIFEKYPYKHVSFLLNKWQMNMGLATLSKYPIIEKRNIDYKSAYNLSMFTDIVVGEDTLRVINNHLESNRVTTKDMQETAGLVHDFTSEKLAFVAKHLSKKMSVAYKIRANQADIVADVVEKSPYKVIVCGDFNDVPSSYTYSRIKGNMRDAFRESGNGLSLTFAYSFFRFRIDYILHDKSFRSAHYKKGTLKSSDHYPIQCDIYFN